MRASSQACAGLLALALAGCAVQPPVAPADGGVVLPAQWSSAAGAAPEAALASWWRGFGDPLLVQLVDEVLHASTDVRAARAQLAQARAVRDAAAAGLLPALSASAGVQRAGLSGAALHNRFDAGFDAAWEVDLFGATGRAVAAGEADAQASAASLGATQVSVAAEAALGYLQLRGAQARVAIAGDNLGLQEQTLQITEWRVQAGLASSIERAQARTAVEQTRAQLHALQGSVAAYEHALAVLAGRPPLALQGLLAAARPLPSPPADIVLDIPARTLRQRPDVMAAELQLQAAAERVAAADAARRPALQLRASLAWEALTLGGLGGTGAARSLAAALGAPLFDGGQRNAQLAAQQAAFEVAREAYRAQVLAALQEVEDALSALRAAQGRVAALGRAAEAARSAALLASQRHASGLVDFQVVLETQRTLLAAQDSLAGAETERVAGHVRLYKALGGGWSKDS